MREFKVDEVFYHSTFGQYSSKITVMEVTEVGKVMVKVSDPFGDGPPVTGVTYMGSDVEEIGVFHPEDAGVDGYTYDDRPCRIGATEEEALAGGKLYHAWWRGRDANIPRKLY